MKTNRFLLASLSLVTALTFSCTDGNNPLAQLFNLGSGSLLAAGFVSNADGIPDGDDSFITDVKINGSAIPGGATSITVTSTEELKEIYIQIVGDGDGYYKWELEPEDEITTPADAPNHVYYIELVFNQVLGDDGEEEPLQLKISGLTVNNETAAAVDETLDVKIVETGNMQVALSWDKTDDVDLYVFLPSNERVFFNNRRSQDGNVKLDLDANYGCIPDSVALGINSENIYFDELKDGDYRVVIQLYKKCEASGTAGARYKVTANVKGQFVTFGDGGEKGQSGKFNDSENGSLVGLSSFPTSSSSNTKIIGTIKIRDGAFVP